MYKIGELSKLCNISVKTLRYYDAEGLLVPDEIDKFTGYRYYSAAKLEDCYRIIALKELGFSLEEIRVQLTADDNARIASALEEKLNELNLLIENTEKQLGKIENIKNGLVKEFPEYKNKIEKNYSEYIERLLVLEKERASLFSVSNMLLQTGYNSLGPVIVNANVAAMNVDGYIYNILNSFYHTCLTFCSQNFGAKKFDRVKKVVFAGVGAATVVGLSLGIFVYVFAKPLVGIFNSDPEILVYAKQRFALVALPYFLCGIMDVGSGFLRSIGYSLYALIITFLGSCALRIAWIYTVFPMFNDVRALYVVFPISWLVTATTLIVTFAVCYKREKKMMVNQLK